MLLGQLVDLESVALLLYQLLQVRGHGVLNRRASEVYRPHLRELASVLLLLVPLEAQLLHLRGRQCVDP